MTVIPHTILSSKASVKVGFIDLGYRRLFSAMKKSALILNSFWIVSIKMSLLCSVLSIESWILDTLNLENGTVVATLCHCVIANWYPSLPGGTSTTRSGPSLLEIGSTIDSQSSGRPPPSAPEPYTFNYNNIACQTVLNLPSTTLLTLHFSSCIV